MADADTTYSWWPVQSWIPGIVFLYNVIASVVTVRASPYVKVYLTIGGEAQGCVEKGVCNAVYTISSSSALFAASTTVVGWYCGRRIPTAKAIIVTRLGGDKESKHHPGTVLSDIKYR